MKPEFNENIEDDDDLLDDEREGEWINYGIDMHIALLPIIQNFLADYFGGKLFNLDQETFWEIDRIIKESMDFGYVIPYILALHCTITDSRLKKEGLKKYKHNDTIFQWPKNNNWYEKSIEKDNEDEEFLINLQEEKLNEKQKEIKRRYNELMDNHADFHSYMKMSSYMFFKAAHTYIEGNASFHLSVLSPKGFIKLEQLLEIMADVMFDQLYGLLEDIIE